jgi:hypothetical protein
MSCEPVITIWGHELPIGQCMTVRVALESFYSSLEGDGLGDNPMGKKMTKSYKENIELIRHLILSGNPQRNIEIAEEYKENILKLVNEKFKFLPNGEAVEK